jgi:phosphonoacetaldehyde hydrolase
MMLLNQETPHANGAKRIVGVIFDWAGTTVDFGSLAPVRTLERVFAEAGVPISEEEARRDMGIAKRDHIAALLAMPRVRTAWEKVRSRPASEADLNEIYQHFIPLQFACLKQYSRVIAGVPEIVAVLRNKGIKIGSTTGYTRAMLDLLMLEAARQGYQPDCSLSPEEAGSGRPQPFMIYAAAIKMQAFPMGALIKIGDTASDIKEGLNAGVWSVGVAGTGNSIGLSETEFNNLTVTEKAGKVQKSRQDLQSAGAHFVIDTLGEIESVISEVEARLNGKSAA